MTDPQNDSTIDRATDGGETVGAADAAEDARGAGADVDAVTEGALTSEDPERATDDGVPVGAADAEADRARAFGDDDR